MVTKDERDWNWMIGLAGMLMLFGSGALVVSAYFMEEVNKLACGITVGVFITLGIIAIGSLIYYANGGEL